MHRGMGVGRPDQRRAVAPLEGGQHAEVVGHRAIDPQPEERLDWLAQVFYQQATLTSQPWYPQFLGGKTRARDAAPRAGIAEHQLAWATPGYR